jgi:hypothetical protein
MLSACGENPCQQERIESRLSNIPPKKRQPLWRLEHQRPPSISAAVKKIAAHAAAVAKQRNKLNEIRLQALWRRPFDPPASPILKSSILRPVFIAAANHRGCLPRPDHVSDGV